MATLHVKETTYASGRNRNYPEGRVKYVVLGNEIFFVGIDPFPQVEGTINEAEQIVQNICAAEGINQQDHTFYDIHTHIQGGTRGKDDESNPYLVDRLDFQGKRVERWYSVASHHYYQNEQRTENIDLAVQAFWQYIEYQALVEVDPLIGVEDIETALNILDEHYGKPLEKRRDEKPVSILNYRLLLIRPYLPESQDRILQKIIWAVESSLFRFFPIAEQKSILLSYMRSKEHTFMGDGISFDLTNDEAHLLSRILDRIGVWYDPIQRTVWLYEFEIISNPVLKDSDPIVTEMLRRGRKKEDLFEYLFQNLERLNLSQQVQIVRKLSKEEVNTFKRRVKKHEEETEELAKYRILLAFIKQLDKGILY